MFHLFRLEDKILISATSRGWTEQREASAWPAAVSLLTRFAIFATICQLVSSCRFRPFKFQVNFCSHLSRPHTGVAATWPSRGGLFRTRDALLTQGGNIICCHCCSSICFSNLQYRRRYSSHLSLSHPPSTGTLSISGNTGIDANSNSRAHKHGSAIPETPGIHLIGLQVHSPESSSRLYLTHSISRFHSISNFAPLPCTARV